MAGAGPCRMWSRSTPSKHWTTQRIVGHAVGLLSWLGTVFPDARAIVTGTDDPAVARSFYGKYVGR